MEEHNFFKTYNIDPLEISEADLEIMQNAQSELFKMLQKPEKLRKLLSDEHVSKLLSQMGEKNQD